MKKLISISIGMMLILAVTMCAVAQTPPTGEHVYRTPIRIIGEFSTSPHGLTPSQMRAAYRYNAIPNQRQNMVIGLVDACDDPDIEADLGVFSTQFNLPSCTTENLCFTRSEEHTSELQS